MLKEKDGKPHIIRVCPCCHGRGTIDITESGFGATEAEIAEYAGELGRRAARESRAVKEGHDGAG